MPKIFAGTVNDARRESGDWAFVDLGFAATAKSCCIAFNDESPKELTYGGLTSELTELIKVSGPPLNLVLEAPLSVTFSSTGNPQGRSIEKRNEKVRYWYLGLGCGVLVAATYLARSLYDAKPTREVRLFEGFVSFKPSNVPSSHVNDVIALKNVIWENEQQTGRIISPADLLVSPSHRLQSAFSVSGFDLGIPPVILGA